MQSTKTSLRFWHLFVVFALICTPAFYSCGDVSTSTSEDSTTVTNTDSGFTPMDTSMSMGTDTSMSDTTKSVQPPPSGN